MGSRQAELDRIITSVERHVHQEKPLSLSQKEIEELHANCIALSWERGAARCLYLLGQYFKNSGNISGANEQFLTARDIGLRLNDSEIIAYGNYGLAQVAFELSNMSEAYAFAKEAQMYAHNCNNSFLLVSCYIIESFIKIRYGEHDAAIIMLQTALSLAKKDAPESVGRILQNIVETHLMNGEYRQAREFAVAYMNLSTSKDQPQKRLNALVRLATIEIELDAIENAQLLLDQAEKLANSKDTIIYATMLCLRGSIALKHKNSTAALQSYEKAKSLYKKFQKIRLESNVMVLIGEACLSENDAAEAIKSATKAFKLAKEAEDRYMTKESLQLLYEAHKASNEMDKSLKYLEEYNELVRQDMVKQYENRLAFVDLKTEYEKKMAQVEEERRRAEAFRSELQRQERELTERARTLIKQTESMTLLRDDLRAIVKRSPGNPIAKQITDRLRSLPESQMTNWNEFEAHFHAVHPEFISRLSEQFPQLTKMERKLCALLRLNLTTGDMAKLLILSERNIENHRYRLRKKLGVATEVSLQEFLSTIR